MPKTTSGTRYEPGDLVLVPFPFTDLRSKKQRPALVVSRASFNRGADVIACAVTSNLANTENSVLIEQGDMANGKLVTPSRVKASKVATLQRSIIRRRVGAVKPEMLRQVVKELRGVLAET